MNQGNEPKRYEHPLVTLLGKIRYDDPVCCHFVMNCADAGYDFPIPGEHRADVIAAYRLVKENLSKINWPDVERAIVKIDETIVSIEAQSENDGGRCSSTAALVVLVPRVDAMGRTVFQQP